MILNRILTVTLLSSFITASAFANFNNEFDRNFVFVQKSTETTEQETPKKEIVESTKKKHSNTRLYTWDLRK